MEEKELDELLTAVGNSTRREILRHLSKEPHYPLQLSKKLNVSQQAVMKHLKTLEDIGLVRSEDRPSPSGPPRRYYALTKRLSVRIDIGPESFSSSLHSIAETPSVDGAAGAEKALFGEYREITEERDPRKRLSQVVKLVGKVNNRMAETEADYNRLVALRSALLREAHQIIARTQIGYDARSVMYCLTERKSMDEISEELDMRMKVLSDIVDEIIDRQFYSRKELEMIMR